MAVLTILTKFSSCVSSGWRGYISMCHSHELSSVKQLKPNQAKKKRKKVTEELTFADSDDLHSKWEYTTSFCLATSLDPPQQKHFSLFKITETKKKKKKSLHSWACQCYTYLMFKSNCVRACQKHSFQFYLPYTALSLTMSLLKVWKILPSVFHSTSKITIINSFLTGNRISW